MKWSKIKSKTNKNKTKQNKKQKQNKQKKKSTEKTFLCLPVMSRSTISMFTIPTRIRTSIRNKMTTFNYMVSANHSRDGTGKPPSKWYWPFWNRNLNVTYLCSIHLIVEARESSGGERRAQRAFRRRRKKFRKFLALNSCNAHTSWISCSFLVCDTE